MRAKLVRYAQDKVMVPIGVPTTPTRTDWNPAERHEEYEQIPSSLENIDMSLISILK